MRINPVAIDEEKTGKNLLEKIESFPFRIIKKSYFADFGLTTSGCPAISNPGPSSVIDVDKILVIEVDVRKILLIQTIYPLNEC